MTSGTPGGPIEVLSVSGRAWWPVAGAAHYADGINEIALGSAPASDLHALLVRDPGNRYDRNAVRVCVCHPPHELIQVGHLPAEVAARFVRAFDHVGAPLHATCEIRPRGSLGGWTIGVFVDTAFLSEIQSGAR